MRLARINTLLLIAVIGVNLITISLPFMPAVTFWWQAKHTNAIAALIAKAKAVPSANDKQSSENRIIIPSMLLDQPIYQGKDERTLSRGLWLRPNGSTPNKGSNTVISGHRFTYTNPKGTLYTLDKVQVGDDITVFWQGKVYRYKVQQVRTVPPTAVEIEAPTKADQLTIYTCTPLWNPVNRLVVTAALQKETP